MPTVKPVPVIPQRITLYEVATQRVTSVQRVDAWELLLDEGYSLLPPNGTWEDVPLVVRQMFRSHPRVGKLLAEASQGPVAPVAPNALEEAARVRGLLVPSGQALDENMGGEEEDDEVGAAVSTPGDLAHGQQSTLPPAGSRRASGAASRTSRASPNG